jgi:hypothetical protein
VNDTSYQSSDAQLNYEEYENDRVAAEQAYAEQEQKEEQQAVVSEDSPFVRADKLFGLVEPPITAYVPRFIYAGATCAIVGPPKRAGKSTIVWTMLSALLNGTEFLGQKCPTVKVAYITEQSRRSFKTQVGRLPDDIKAGIIRNPNLYVAYPENHLGPLPDGKIGPLSTWEERLSVWLKFLEKQSDVGIVVLDTFNKYAALGTGGENDNAVIGARLYDLEQLKAGNPSRAVLLVHHSRKEFVKGSGVTAKYLSLESIRGGSAFAGALDHGVTVTRGSSWKDTNVRFFHVESRLEEEMFFDLERKADGSYEDVTPPEKAETVKKLTKPERAVTLLKQNPDWADLTIEKMQNKFKEQGLKICGGGVSAAREIFNCQFEGV